MSDTPKSTTAAEQATRLTDMAAELEALLRQQETVAVLNTSDIEQQWSVRQILGHVAEMIPYWLHFCQAIIAAPAETVQLGRSLDAPERLAGVARAETMDIAALLDQITQEIVAARTMILAMTVADRACRGRHFTQGVMMVADVIELFVVSHAEAHLAQMRQTLESQSDR